MNSLVIKALCRRMQFRYGSNEAAAKAADVSPGVWSNYCSDEKPDTTIPFHRLFYIANVAERAAFADLLLGESGPTPACLLTEASETTEAAADMQRAVRQALADGKLTPLEKKGIRAQAIAVQAQAAGVVAGLDGAA